MQWGKGDGGSPPLLLKNPNYNYIVLRRKKKNERLWKESSDATMNIWKVDKLINYYTVTLKGDGPLYNFKLSHSSS